MEITCSQMDVLLSFYIEGDLSKPLKAKVDEHLKICSTCRAKLNIIKTMLEDLKTTVETKEEVYSTGNSGNQYRIFQNNLSAYVDNELPVNESIKFKKYTINNKKARKDLEETYNIRRLLKDSFHKTKFEARQDFSKKVLKQLQPNEEENLGFHPVLKLAIFFVVTVLVISSIVIYSFTL